MRSAPRLPAFPVRPTADGLGLALVATALDARTVILPRSGLVGERVGGRMILRSVRRAA